MKEKFEYEAPAVELIEMEVDQPVGNGPEKSSKCGARSCCYGGDESSNGW